MLSDEIEKNTAGWSKNTVARISVWLSHELLSLASPQTSSNHPLSFHPCGPLSSVLLREDAIIMTTESSMKARIM